MLFITCRSIDSKSRPSLSILCHKKEEREPFVSYLLHEKQREKLPQMFYIFKNDMGKICFELNVKKSDAKNLKTKTIWPKNLGFC